MAFRVIALVFAWLPYITCSHQAHKVAQRHASADPLESIAALFLATHLPNNHIQSLGQLQSRLPCARCSTKSPGRREDSGQNKEAYLQDFLNADDKLKLLSRRAGNAQMQSWPPQKSKEAPKPKESPLKKLKRRLVELPLYKRLMLALTALFALQSLAPSIAISTGARVNSAISRGEWHRLFTPVLLHAGGQHVVGNVLSIWRMGPFVEDSYGKANALLLFLASGIGGNLAGLWFGNPLARSVGASVAVFGMMGAAAGYLLKYRGKIGKDEGTMTRNVAGVVILNCLFGMKSAQIDNMAHVGGFVTGLGLGTLLAPPKTVEKKVDAFGARFGGKAAAAGPSQKAILPLKYSKPLLSVVGLLYLVSIGQASLIAGPLFQKFGRV